MGTIVNVAAIMASLSAAIRASLTLLRLAVQDRAQLRAEKCLDDIQFGIRNRHVPGQIIGDPPLTLLLNPSQV